MGTIEKLFVQIFERKKWIEDQVKRQTLLFDQQLASKCLLDGIAPPPWLLPSPPSELNKEELISGLLLPCPPLAVPYSGNCYSIYNNRTLPADNRDLPDSFLKGVHTSYKGFDAGDRFSVLPQLPVNDVVGGSNGTQKGDSSAAISQPDRGVEGPSDVSPEPAQSLENFQRSKSRQRALALRNSAKIVASNLRDGNNAGGITGSEIATLQHDYVQELDLVESVDISKESCKVEEAKLGEFQGKGSCKVLRLSVLPQFPVNDVGGPSNGTQKGASSDAISLQDHGVERLSDVSPKPAESLENFQKSKSRQRDLALRNSAKLAGSNLRDENNSGVLAGGITGSEIATQQHDYVQELELVESDDISKESCKVEKAKLGEFQGKGSESRAEELISPLILGLQPATSHSSRECIPYYQPAVLFENEELPDASNKEVHTLSEGLVAKDELLNLCQFTVNDAGFVPKCLLEMDFSAECPHDQRSSGNSDIDPKPLQSLARVQRSKSRLRALEVRNSVKAGKSCIPLENDRCVYSSVFTGSRITSLQSDQICKSELIKAADFDNESCEVVGTKLYDYQSKEKSSKIYSGSITRSQKSAQQPSSIRESSNAGTLSYAGRPTRYNNYKCCPESSKQQSEDSVSLGRGIDSGMVGSLPQLKQIKVGGRLTDAVSGAPSLREDDVVQSNEKRSSVDKMDHVDQLVTEGSKSSPAEISPIQPDQIHESGLVKSADFDNESCQVEGVKVYDFQSKDKSSNIYSGRITRSRSSARQPSSTRESSHSGKVAYAGRSSRDDNNVGCPESNDQQIEEISASLGRGFGSGMVGSLPQLKQRKIGGRLTNDVSAAPSLREDDVVQSNEDKSPVDKMDNVEQLVTEGSKSSRVGLSSLQPEPVYVLELIKPADAYCESCVVKEANIGDIQSKENSSNAVSDMITRSQTPSQQCSSTGNSLNARTSSDEDKIVGSSESRQKSGKKSILPGNNFICGAEDPRPQHKRRKVEGHLSDYPSASPSLREEGVEQSGVNKSPGAEMDWNGDYEMKLELQSSHKLQVDKDKPSSEERDRSAKNTPFTFVQELEVPSFSSFINQATGDPKACSDVEVAVLNTTRAILDTDRQCAMGGNEVLLHLLDKFEPGTTEHLSFAERGMHEGKCHLGGNGESSQCSVGSPQRQTIELICADQVMPEFGGFIMETDNVHSCTEGMNFNELDLPNTTIERASVLEQLCKSACMHTPLSHFPTTYKLHRAPNLHQSVPNGLLECIDLRINPSINDNIVKQLKASYRCFDKEANHAFQGRSYSDCLPFSSVQPASDIRKPFGSPIGKFWDRITSNSASSEKRGRSNPELPCISEENESTDEVADSFQEGISLEIASPVGELWDWTTSNSSSSEKQGSLNLELPFISEDENRDTAAGVHQVISSQVMPSSVQRESLGDITENPNLPASISKADIFADRSSLESVKAKFSFSGTCNRAKQKHGHYTSNKKKHTRQAKVSHGTSLGENGINRVSHNRFSKPKLNGRPSLGKGGPSFADRETKRNNIVSNVTSFIPLVQQKQAAAIITGKRDVKVKALEAAEAAKRFAEEKENERKMKKEALKLERAKLEQENFKQLELQKKKKEEERKKKEADVAARKRRREEDERKEKERKRKRVVEARKQQQEIEEKLRAKKEEERKKKEADMLMVSKDETQRDNKRVRDQREENLGTLKTESKATVVSTSDARDTSIVLQVCKPSTDLGYISKATSHLEKATENDLITNQNQEPSYDISPYKDSDNEEEEDDDRPNTKFIPSWASKRASALLISSLQSVNPEGIFPLGSFCGISEVLLPRRLQLNRKL